MEIDLKKYVEKHGQTTTAKRFGVTQGTIWQMLRSARKIFVVEDNGIAELVERKTIGAPLIIADFKNPEDQANV